MKFGTKTTEMIEEYRYIVGKERKCSILKITKTYRFAIFYFISTSWELFEIEGILM